MKAVVLDGYTENPGDLSWDWLKAFGEYEVYDRTPGGEAEIIRRIGEAEIVITNKVPISDAPAPALNISPSLRRAITSSTMNTQSDAAYRSATSRPTAPPPSRSLP